MIKKELIKLVDNLNFLDVMQFFTSKLFSKLLATEPTQEQTDTLQKWKQSPSSNLKRIKSDNDKDDDHKSFDMLDYEIFTSNKDTIHIISKINKNLFINIFQKQHYINVNYQWSFCLR